jgi:ADP-ribosylglycohydrolase
MIKLPYEGYRAKVLGCWLGKAVGGTLGGPWEGHDGSLDLAFYDPVPDRMLPNDDLDLQVVWVEAIRRFGLPIHRRLLAAAWAEHNRLYPDEYGVACFNLARGLYPPLSGWFDNPFTDGMGCAIRTELWACLAPGDPELARALMTEDGCVDHAGDGLFAALYLVTLQSAAFVEDDRERLLDLAQAAIPAHSRVARAIAETRAWWASSGDWRAVRALILADHGRQNFTDVAQNLAFTVLGWLAGEGDFGRSICIAVNCGCDTDCTGATLGALLGILDPPAIGPEWLAPIGRELVLSPSMVAMHAAPDLEAFTDQVAALAGEVLVAYDGATRLDGAPDLAATRANQAPARAGRPRALLLDQEYDPAEALLADAPLPVYLRYPPAVALAPGVPASFGLRFVNPTAAALDGQVRWRVPDGWRVTPAGTALSLPPGGQASFDLTVTPPPAAAARPARNPLDLTLTLGDLSWTVSAGLPTTVPWRRWPLAAFGDACPEPPADAETVEAPGVLVPVPPGGWAFTTEVKLPFSGPLRLVAQTLGDEPRGLTAWVDGAKVLQHDGVYQVPASHRPGPGAADLALRAGWHRLTVAVADGAGGELFARVGSASTWDWLRDAEWREVGA